MEVSSKLRCYSWQIAVLLLALSFSTLLMCLFRCVQQTTTSYWNDVLMNDVISFRIILIVLVSCTYVFFYLIVFITLKRKVWINSYFIFFFGLPYVGSFCLSFDFWFLPTFFHFFSRVPSSKPFIDVLLLNTEFFILSICQDFYVISKHVRVLISMKLSLSARNMTAIRIET